MKMKFARGSVKRTARANLDDCGEAATASSKGLSGQMPADVRIHAGCGTFPT
ncbi:MAG: hypothetical protein RL616_2355 [Verrucomicrobiota bacterium]